MVYSFQRNITLIDDGEIIAEGITYSATVDGLLRERSIELFEGDKINFAPEKALADDMVIEVYRAMPVTVLASGEEKSYLSIKRTPFEILGDLGFSVKEDDIIVPGAFERVEANTYITLIKTASEVISEDVQIPFETKNRDNNSLEIGKSNLVQEGRDGLKTVEYEITYHDGEEVSRVVVGETIQKEMVTQVREIGTRGSMYDYQIASHGFLQTSRSGELKYSAVLLVDATAYDASFESNGKHPDANGQANTATGTKTRPGVVAVDPRIIPYHTKMWIEAVDGSWVYGVGYAEDTGGAIKGNKIDLFFNTRSEVYSFGRRKAKVYILED